MRSHQREHTLVAAGLLLFGCLVLALATSCDRSPMGGCPPSFDEGDPAPLSSNWGHQSPPATEKLTSKWFCLWFPRWCQVEMPDDPFGDIYYWGGPDFAAKREDVPHWAAFHNASLDAWREAERSPAGLLSAMNEAAASCGVENLLPRESQSVCLNLFERVLAGDLQPPDMPTHADIMSTWQKRPAKGPFAHDSRMEELLSKLEDGISAAEVQEWATYAESKKTQELREYWSASCMAASVEWWYEFSEDVGENCAYGVYADLAAIMRGGTWQMVAAASLVGALVDVMEHFWPQEGA